MTLIAHRGESYLAPENTLAAIELAWSNGIREVEFDVRLTRDGRLVVCHDADTLRTGGQKLVIAQHDADQLCHVDVGRWKGDQWAGVRLPTLEQVLATIPPGGRVFIEIKDGPESIPPLVEALAGIDPAQCVVISFHANVIAAAKEALPAVEACWLVSQQRDPQLDKWTPDAPELIATARSIHADGLDLAAHPDAQNSTTPPRVDAALVRALHAAGLKVYVWTIDDPARAQALLDAGVDGLTTNRPAWMAEQLRLEGPQ
jgi:glycerophosphoryl diester phosphodiesterase